MKSKVNKRPFIQVVLGVLSHCSYNCLYNLSVFFSYFIAHTNNRVSSMTQQNIELCFSGESNKSKKKIFKQSIIHTTLSFLELAAIWFKPIESVFKKLQILDTPKDFLQNQKAKIIIAPHFGSWELLNLWLADHFEIYSLYKPAKSTAINNFVLNGRTITGAHLVPTSTVGLRALLVALKNNHTVMILPDQRPHRQSAQLNSNFFNHSAPTTTLIYKLLSKVDCNVYMAAAIRQALLKGYNIKVTELDSLKLKENPQASTDYLNWEIQQFINKDIEQYQWSYRRFTDKTYGKN